MKTYKKLLTGLELKRVPTDIQCAKIQSSQDGVDFIRQFYFDDLEIYESFFILLLNRANNTIAYAKISQGGVVGTVVDPKILCKYVVESLASSVILAHNHPSGNKQPSDSDRMLTKKIAEALKLLDSTVLDHVILTKDSYFSFADEGLL